MADVLKEVDADAPNRYKLLFGQVFKKNPSFKIAMSGRAGVVCRASSEVYLLVNFFFFFFFFKVVSCMLPLFFSGLLLYLVRMKRRPSRHVTRWTTLTLFVMYLSPLTSQVNLLVNLFFFFQSKILPLFFSGLLSDLVGMKKRTSK